MFGSKSFMNYKRKEMTPDLTPLIDVVFLLLIFFMVATTFENTGGLKIELPKSQMSKSEDVPEKISVLISKEREIRLKIEAKSGTRIEEISKDQMRSALEKELSALSDKRVAISADKGIEYGDVVDVMSDIKMAGAQSIDIETKKE